MASTEQIAKEYFNKGWNYVRTNNIEMGIDNLNMAKSIYEELDDSTNYILTMRGLAIAYGFLGYDSKMLQKCLNAFSYIDKHGIRGAKHYFFTTICNRYMVLGDYDSAINYGKMAMQDLEEYGTEFPNKPKFYLIACLNLAYSYVHINRFDETEHYLKRATEIAKKNDLIYHDLSIAVIQASLHHKTGDNQYVYAHLEELVTSIKSTDISINDYMEDLKLLIETFCGMKEFDRAEAVAMSLDSFGTIAGNPYMNLEATKLLMMIYKASNNTDKYNEACVRFAESSIEIYHTEATRHLLDMDTEIALSIADTPAELL